VSGRRARKPRPALRAVACRLRHSNSGLQVPHPRVGRADLAFALSRWLDRAAEAPASNIRYLPTTPLEFASPSGNCLDLDFRSNLGVSAPLAQRITAFAFCRCVRFCLSK